MELGVCGGYAACERFMPIMMLDEEMTEILNATMMKEIPYFWRVWLPAFYVFKASWMLDFLN